MKDEFEELVDAAHALFGDYCQKQAQVMMCSDFLSYDSQKFVPGFELGVGSRE